jgi:hypothetical protein
MKDIEQNLLTKEDRDRLLKIDINKTKLEIK